jgi:hypothetical protein
MLDRSVSFSYAQLRACRREVLRVAGAALLVEISPPPDDGGRFRAMQPITTLVARSALSRSTEAGWLDHVLGELDLMPAARKAEAVEAALSAAVDPILVASAIPSLHVPDEEMAVAIVSILVDRANARFDPNALRLARRFPPRLRARAATLVSAADGAINSDRADLLSAAAVGVLDTASFDAALGMRDLLRRMRLSKAAGRITPAGTGPIARFSPTTFRRWSQDPQNVGLLDNRSLQQRRQIEFASRVASTVLAHAHISAATADAMIRWGLTAAVKIPAGRFGSKYLGLVRWMTDSVAPPRRGLRPRRAWTPKISVQTALSAAAAHVEVLRNARKGFRPFALPAEAAGADDQWPRGGALEDELSIRRLWSLSTVQSVGQLLSNCLHTSSVWARRHQAGEAAIYAVLAAGEVIGGVALGHDLTGALSIIESGGPFNSPLSAAAQRAVQGWVGSANADASKGG